MYDNAMKARTDYINDMEGSREEGRVEGRVEGEKSVLAKQLQLKFGKSADKYIELVFKADEKKIQNWLALILTANKINDVFED